MEEDGEGSGVGCEDNDLGDSAVESLGRLVRTFLQLAVMAGLLDNVEDLLREGRVGDGPGCRKDVRSFFREKIILAAVLTSARVLFVRHDVDKEGGKSGEIKF